MNADFKAIFLETNQLTATFHDSDQLTAEFGEMYRSGDYEYYEGEYVVTPQAWEETVLETEGLVLTDDVTVLRIPYFETSNLGGGKTAIIGGQ